MKKINKIILTFSMLLLSVLLLVACDDITEEDSALDKAKENLTYEVILKDNEDKDHVLSDLNLITEDGDVLIEWESSNEDAVKTDGTVTRLSEDALVTLTATLKLEEDSTTKDFKVTVVKEEEEEKAPLVAIETFDVTPLTGSYASNTFVGVAGFKWSYALARDEGNYPISGSGILLQKEGGFIKVELKNGLEEFSFEYRKAFTGGNPRDYAVDIKSGDNVETYILPTFGEGSGADDTVYEFKVDELGLEGDVEITVYAPEKAAQATFDNFTFTLPTDTLGSYVTFDPNGGELNSPEKQLVLDGGNLLMPPNPELVNKNFDGWLLDGELFDIETSITEDITLVAKWSDVEEISINEFLQLNEGNHGYIKGIITSDAMFNSFSIEDETGAVALRIAGVNAKSELEFEIGSEVKALVRKGLFNGLIQAEVVLDVELEVSSELKELPNAVNLDEVDFEDFVSYQSHLITLTDLEFVSATGNFQNDDLAITFKRGEDLIKANYNGNFASPLVTFLNELEAGDRVDVVAAPLGWSNGALISLYEISHIRPTDLNSELGDFYTIFTDIFSLNLEEEQIETDGYILELPDKSLNGFDVVWEVLEGEDYIDLLTGEITMPEETVMLILKASIVKNDASISKTIEVRLWVKSIYGDDLVLDLNNLKIPGTTYDGGALKPAEVNGFEFVTTYTMPSGEEIQSQANNMRLWNNDSLGKINRIVIELRAPSDHELHVGDSSKPTDNKVEADVDGNVYTYDITGDYGFFELHNLNGAMYIKSVTIYYDLD